MGFFESIEDEYRREAVCAEAEAHELDEVDARRLALLAVEPGFAHVPPPALVPQVKAARSGVLGAPLAEVERAVMALPDVNGVGIPSAERRVCIASLRDLVKRLEELLRVLEEEEER